MTVLGGDSGFNDGSVARELMERYRLLTVGTRDIILFVRLDGRIQEANEAALRAYGYTQEELLGLSILDLRAVDGPEIVRRQMAVAATEGSVRFEAIHKRKDGSVFPVEVTSVAAEVGGAPMLLSTVHDISFRNAAAAALRESEERFRTLFTEMGEGFALHEIVSDENGLPVDLRYLEINPAFERLTGLSKDRVIGKTMGQTLPGSEREWLQTYNGVALSGESVMLRRHHDGLDRDYEVIAFCPAKGRFATLFLDVTEETNLQRELQSRMDTLQAIMESTLVQLAYLLPDTTIAMVNSAYAIGSGLTKEDLVGRKYFDVFPDDDNRRVFDMALQTGEPVRFFGRPFVYERQPWRGVTYWDAAVTPMKDREGTVQGLVLSLVDVTENVRGRMLNDALNTVNATVNSTLDLDDALNRALKESSQALGTAAGMVCLHEDVGWIVRHAVGDREFSFGHICSEGDAGICARASQSAGPVAIHCDPGSETEERPTIAVSLALRDQVVGVLMFSHSRPLPFSSDQVDFVRKLGVSVSLALQNAGLFHQLEEALEREHGIAQMLQKALAPGDLSAPAGYEVADAYIPAYVGDQIGGDFEDIFLLRDGRFAALIGDVSGKGIAAASLAADARSTIRALAYHAHSPGRVLADANAVLYSNEPFRAFVTAYLAIIDPSTGVVRYSSAGHPPGVVCRVDGGVELLTAGGLPIGLASDEALEEGEFRLAPGDRLIVYTDGVTEARRGGEMLSVEGLMSVVRAHSDASCRSLLDAILEAATEWAGGALRDDTAVMVIRRMDQG